MITAVRLLYMWLPYAINTYAQASAPTAGSYVTGCTLPSSFGTAIVGGKVSGCEAGGVLARGARCEVMCNANYAPSAGATTQYECTTATGALLQPNVTCTAFSELRCVLPSQFGEGQTSAGANGCLPGGALLSSSDPAATDLNTGCAIQCAQGYIGDTGSRKYACRNGPAFAKLPTLLCRPARDSTCMLPRSFGVGVKGATCQAGGELSSHAKCTVTCQADHVTADRLTSDDFVYTCVNGRLTVPAAHCRPEAKVQEPTLEGHALTLSLAGFLADFGPIERTSVTSYLAVKLGVSAEKDLQLTFSSGSVILSAIVRGSSAAAIIDLAYALATRFDDSWPLVSFPVMIAKYDGPVVKTKLALCRMIVYSSMPLRAHRYSHASCIARSRHPRAARTGGLC